jgi:hypothetical protein
MNVEAPGKYAASYGVPTAATITGFPVAISWLTSFCCCESPQALNVVTITRSSWFALLTAVAISASEG